MKKYVFDEEFSGRVYKLVEVDNKNFGQCPVCNGKLEIERHSFLHSDVPEKFNVCCSDCGRFFERSSDKV